MIFVNRSTEQINLEDKHPHFAGDKQTNYF